MSTIKINTESAGPSFITLNAGSTYTVSANSNFEKTIIEETDSTGSAISTITINKYKAPDADINWRELNQAAYEAIELLPAQFDYPTYAGFGATDYLLKDLRDGFSNIINGALGNDLPAEYSEWLAWSSDKEANKKIEEAIASGNDKEAETKAACSDALGNCPDGGFYFNVEAGGSCDCDSGSSCCDDLGAQVKAAVIEAGAPELTKKHQYIFASVEVSSPAES